MLGINQKSGEIVLDHIETTVEDIHYEILRLTGRQKSPEEYRLIAAFDGHHEAIVTPDSLVDYVSRHFRELPGA